MVLLGNADSADLNLSLGSFFLKVTVKAEKSFENISIWFQHLCVKAFDSHIEATSHWETNTDKVDSF